MTLPDIGGLVGVTLMLVAYALGQLGRMRIDSLPALLMNLGGAVLVMISLWFKFNLSAFLMEAAWALVALFGLAKLLIRRKADRRSLRQDGP
ncbi:MAG: CBU_0592 family membrane protein [Caulobacteraceae bacterium]